MRNILSDWFDEELFEMDQPAALQKLYEIFSHPSVNMKQISSKMTALREASGSGVNMKQIAQKMEKLSEFDQQVWLFY